MLVPVETEEDGLTADVVRKIQPLQSDALAAARVRHMHDDAVEHEFLDAQL
jgi:hypothetical protein